MTKASFTKALAMFFIQLSTAIIIAALVWYFIVQTFFSSFFVSLPNGFIIAPTNNSIYKISLLDKNQNLLIKPNIEDISWHKNYVYGYRFFKNEDGKRIYSQFICKENEVCEIFDNDDDFSKRQKILGLPYKRISEQYSYQKLIDNDFETYTCFFCNWYFFN